MNIILRAISSILLLSVISAHQFFISTTEIQFKPEEQRAEITIQVFTHDIDLLLENANFKTIDLGTDKESDAIDIFLANYLSDNFIIQEYRWNYLGKEVGDDYTAFFLEIENFSLSPKISILNSLFMDLYTKQRNIVNFYNDKVIQSASMTNTNPVFSFNF
ncbi:MAG: hypothetical protein P8L43_04775 [Candidatus Marinimicrobia bacterium]|jgi:hypothetical protein|nr:hypothetical protein [Candidatus Neomarinimicrobiota bacterium]|tara:strand:- start:101 stop:583 length:483 start_codon:yes stop_codon:yes gene_type:complete